MEFVLLKAMKGTNDNKTQKLYILYQLQDYIHTLAICQEKVSTSICPSGGNPIILESRSPVHSLRNICEEIDTEREKLFALLEEVTIYRDSFMKIEE